MYRAKIDDVSGGKVYADGKWLTCIGNKNFRTGELVWTDGRCAYGNYQESQQPQVIIAPDDTGFPILFFKRKTYVLRDTHFFYSFQKNKLKQGEEMDKPDDLSWAQWGDIALINDKNRVFTHNYIAANIDSQGNIFVMAEIKKSDDDDYVTEHKAVIFKSDKSSKDLNPSQELKFNKVREIDLLAFFQANVMSKFTPVEIPYGDLHTGDGDGGVVADHCAISENAGCDIFRACIEDENNFDFLVGAGIGQVVDYANAFKIALSGYEGTFQIKNDAINLLEETTESGIRDARTKDIYGDIDVRFILDEETQISGDKVHYIDNAFHRTSSTNTNTITCSAGDGFYYTMTPERIPEYVEADIMAAGGEYRMNLFTPNGTLIADFYSTCRRSDKILAQKVKGGYLIALYALKIYSVFGKSPDEFEEPLDVLDSVFNGILFCSPVADKVKILEWCEIHNDRFRPMKKIKNWHKRIKKIKLDLDENQDDNSAD